jgi:hypothetical protein
LILNKIKMRGAIKMIRVFIRHIDDANGYECGEYSPKEAVDFLELIKKTGAVIPNDAGDYEDYYTYCDSQYIATENKLDIIVEDV